MHRQNIFQFFSRIVFDSCAVSSHATDKKTSCTQMLFDHIHHHLFRRLLMSLSVLIKRLHHFSVCINVISYFRVGTSVVNDHVNSPSDQCQFNILNSSYDFIIMDLVHGSTIRIFKSLKFSIIAGSNKHNDIRVKGKTRERVVLRFVRSIVCTRKRMVCGVAK